MAIIASQLATRLGWQFAEADLFHSPANVAKMRSAVALTDDDRWPWLGDIATWIDAARASGTPSTTRLIAFEYPTTPPSRLALAPGTRPSLAATSPAVTLSAVAIVKFSSPSSRRTISSSSSSSTPTSSSEGMRAS